MRAFTKSDTIGQNMYTVLMMVPTYLEFAHKAFFVLLGLPFFFCFFFLRE